MKRGLVMEGGGMRGLFTAGVTDVFLENKIAEAREIQIKVNEIIALLCSGHGNMYAMIKEVLRLRKGLEIGSVRSPLTPLTKEDKKIAEKTAKVIDDAVAHFC